MITRGTAGERRWDPNQRIRTVAEVPLQIVLADSDVIPVHQRIAASTRHLRELGLSFSHIASKLGGVSKIVPRGIVRLSQVRADTGIRTRSRDGTPRAST